MAAEMTHHETNKTSEFQRNLLALAISNWLADRPLMRLNNSASNVAKLLHDEMHELHEALHIRETNPVFDETPGEVADIIFFALTMLSQLHAPMEQILSELPQDGTNAGTANDLLNLSDEIIRTSRQPDRALLLQGSINFLSSAYAFAYAIGLNPTGETLEKTAYNHTRYLAGNFQLGWKEKIAARLISFSGTPERLRTLAQTQIEQSFKRAKKAGRQTTTALNLKQTFYELEIERATKRTEASLPPQSPQRASGVRKLATAFASLISTGMP